MSSKKALVLGGNRFFGRHLTLALIEDGFEVTLLNRGLFDDGLGGKVERLQADRQNEEDLSKALHGKCWDFVFDQICFTAKDARSICQILEGSAGKVLFTSSQSVYGIGLEIPESAFDPYHHVFKKEVSADEDYAEAKRQAETVFTSFPDLNPVMMRMPLVIGPDDYTGRFRWHIERCRLGLPIYFPNENARIGFIRSDLAGAALLAVAKTSHQGPLNCACPGDIRLAEFMKVIEESTGTKYIRAQEASDESQSPYGIEQNWTMSLKKISSIGVESPGIMEWLPELVRRSR